jgi:TPR repeat protein
MDLNYEIDEEVEKRIDERCPTPHWGNCLFNWLTPKLRELLYKVIADSPNAPYFSFLKGVRYEYGIDTEVDNKKAYDHYMEAAKAYDGYALYKVYTMYRKDSTKFGLLRDKNIEIYYLIKSMAYSDAVVFFNNDTLYNVDVLCEIAFHLEELDPNLDKLNNLITEMKYKVDDCEIRFIEAMTLIKFNLSDEEIEFGMTILKDLAENDGYLEAIYKLACFHAKQSDRFIKDRDIEIAAKYFKILEEKEFYKAFNDYGLFLYQEGMYDKCLEVLKKGIDNGNFRCYFLYYDCFLSKFDFEHGDPNDLVNLLNFVCRDLVTGNVFSFFEYFYTCKILQKHYGITNLDKTYEAEFLKIINIVYVDRSILSNNFAKGIVETEFLLSLGFVYYIGINGGKDFELSEHLLKESFNMSSNFSYKRFCYSYIFKIRIKENCLEATSKENGGNSVLTKLEKTKQKMYKIYMESLEGTRLEDFSSSYFYFLAKIYEYGWGCKKDDLSAYCYYLHGSTAKVKHLGTGTIIAYFRRHKAGLKLRQEKYRLIAESIEKMNPKEISTDITDDDNLCCICYENLKDIIFYPCKHLMCIRCYEILKQNQRCPICRTKIILTK